MLVQAIIKRILIGVVTLLVVSIIIFIGTSLLPGDVANIILGQMATPESLAALREHLGLDQPPHTRYLMWLGNLLSGDLGMSKAGTGVGTVGTEISVMIQPRLVNTLRLAGMVALISIPMAMGLGLLASMYPGSRIDRAITFTTLSIISVPDFLVAMILVMVLAVQLGWLPSIAYMSGNETGWQLIRALLMPTLTLVTIVSAQIIRDDPGNDPEHHEFTLYRDGDSQGSSQETNHSQALFAQYHRSDCQRHCIEYGMVDWWSGHCRNGLRLPRFGETDDRRSPNPGSALGPGMCDDLLCNLCDSDHDCRHGIDHF